MLLPKLVTFQSRVWGTDERISHTTPVGFNRALLQGSAIVAHRKCTNAFLAAARQSFSKQLQTSPHWDVLELTRATRLGGFLARILLIWGTGKQTPDIATDSKSSCVSSGSEIREQRVPDKAAVGPDICSELICGMEKIRKRKRMGEKPLKHEPLWVLGWILCSLWLGLPELSWACLNKGRADGTHKWAGFVPSLGLLGHLHLLKHHPAGATSTLGKD